MEAEPEPLPEQPPVVLMATAPPGAVAATLNELPKAALPGAGAVTVIV